MTRKLVFDIETIPLPDAVRSCLVESCLEPTNAKGLCQRHYNQQYRRAHAETIREYQRRWCAANPEKERASQQRYRQKNAEKVRDASQRYRQENIEKARSYAYEHRKEACERARRWSAAHPNEARERTRQWCKDNPERVRALRRRREARVLGAEGSFTAEEWRALCDYYGNRCLCCGLGFQLHADHVVPLSKGGSNDISNIQPLCRSCNSRKGTKSTDYRQVLQAERAS